MEVIHADPLADPRSAEDGITHESDEYDTVMPGDDDLDSDIESDGDAGEPEAAPSMASLIFAQILDYGTSLLSGAAIFFILHFFGVFHTIYHEVVGTGVLFVLSSIFLASFAAIVLYLSFFVKDDTGWEIRFFGVLLVALIDIIAWFLFFTLSLWSKYSYFSPVIAFLLVLLVLDFINLFPGWHTLF